MCVLLFSSWSHVLHCLRSPGCSLPRSARQQEIIEAETALSKYRLVFFSTWRVKQLLPWLLFSLVRDQSTHTSSILQTRFPPPDPTFFPFAFPFFFKCTNTQPPSNHRLQFWVALPCPRCLGAHPLPRHLQTISVGAKQSQQWLDPGTYERSSLISHGQELHKGSKSETQTQLQMRHLCVCRCVCDVVFFFVCVFLWPVKLFSWRKKNPILESLFILFYVLWFSPVPSLKLLETHLFCLPVSL